ncbi:unnamed protein product [Lathyrus sativus]|nr:unnamed protein product [Lathyrus sativus]
MIHNLGCKGSYSIIAIPKKRERGFLGVGTYAHSIYSDIDPSVMWEFPLISSEFLTFSTCCSLPFNRERGDEQISYSAK